MNSSIRFVLTLCVAALAAFGSANATEITSAASGAWSDTLTWQGGVLPGATDTVRIRSIDSVTIDVSMTCAGLIVDGWFATSKTNLVDMTINGDLTVNTGATFKVQTAVPTAFTGPHTLTITGNITNSGLVFDLRSGSAGSTLGVINITFAGTTNSTVTMLSAYSGTNGDFNGITINKSGTAKVILGSDMFINGGSSTGPSSMTSILTFVNGIVETGDFTLTHLTGTSANVVGASGASYVLGAMGRGMANSAGSSKDFPVGDATGYRPLSLRSTTAGGSTGHHAIVRAIDGNANTGSSTLVGGIDRVSAVRYYKIKYRSVLGAPDSMSFDRFYPTYGTDDGVAVGNMDLRVAYSADNRATWTKLGQDRYPHTTDLSLPPTQIRPDSLNPPVLLHGGVDSIFIALADSVGGPNPLQRSTVITATAGTGGSIVPAGVVTVVLGASQVFTITPSGLYTLDSLLVDGALVTPATEYTFTNVTIPHTIRAAFRMNSTAMINVSLAAGWNLIANPVTNPVPGDSVQQMFPTSSNPYAFEFGGGGYVQRYTLANGKGYWGKFPGAISQPVTGAPRTQDTIVVSPGWNIVGTISCPVDTGLILSIPADLRGSNWFGYASGYTPVTQLVPGQGYWVKANAAGTFILGCPPAAPAQKETRETE
jgi:hypothetical protein